MYFLEQYEYIRTIMKAITLNFQNSFKAKHVLTAGVLALTGLLAPATASASLVSGNATITIDNTAFIAANDFANYIETHWGASDNQLAIDASTTGGTTLSLTGSTAMEFAVNTNTTTNIYNSAGAYGRTEQATTMDVSDTSIGQIGLSGAMRINGPGGLLTPYDLRLVSTNGTWNISTYDNAFGYNDFLTLTSVSESIVNGELSLTGNLQLTGLWANMLGANTTVVVGSFNLAPSAVPVPAAVWLFGTGLVGLIGAGKRKKIQAV